MSKQSAHIKFPEIQSGHLRVLQYSAYYYEEFLKNNNLHFLYIDGDVKDLKISFFTNNFLHLAGADVKNYRLAKSRVLNALAEDCKRTLAGEQIKPSIKAHDLKFSYHYDGNSQKYFIEKNRITKQMFCELSKYKNICPSNTCEYDYIIENICNNNKASLCVKYEDRRDAFIPRSICDKSIMEFDRRACQERKLPILLIYQENRKSGKCDILSINNSLGSNQANKILNYLENKNSGLQITESLRKKIKDIGVANTNAIDIKARKEKVQTYINHLRKRGKTEKASIFNDLWIESKKEASLNGLKKQYFELTKNNFKSIAKEAKDATSHQAICKNLNKEIPER